MFTRFAVLPILIQLYHVVDRVDDHHDFRPPQLMPNHSELKRTDYEDSSWPLYGMYSNIVEGEDNRQAEYLQQHTNGVLILVSLHVTSPLLHASN